MAVAGAVTDGVVPPSESSEAEVVPGLCVQLPSGSQETPSGVRVSGISSQAAVRVLQGVRAQP